LLYVEPALRPIILPCLAVQVIFGTVLALILVAQRIVCAWKDLQKEWKQCA